MKILTRNVLLVFCLLCINLSVSAQKWVKLFDNKTLNGWHTANTNYWHVKDGVLIGTSPATEFKHVLLISDKVFKDFEVEIVYKAIRGNSGLYFRTEETNDIYSVKGFQAEIDPNQDTGGLFETSGRGWVIRPTAEQVNSWYKKGKWNKMKVRAVGRDITVWVNGKKSAELMNDPGRLDGHIALQLHGSMDMDVMFREVKIKEL
jgi:hypothetical protein